MYEKNCEKIYLNSHECMIYDRLYTLPELECFREQMTDYFKKRYGIDYISMSILNKDRNIMFFRIDNDKWHEAHKKYNWPINDEPLLMDRIDKVKPNEIYLEYFDMTFSKSRSTSEIEEIKNIRAEIFGVRKYGGCDILLSNNNNDIILYYITFKDDRSFGNLFREVLNELIKDLIRYRDLFTPFCRYGEMGGDFMNKTSLTKHLDEFKMDNRSLFHIA